MKKAVIALALLLLLGPFVGLLAIGVLATLGLTIATSLIGVLLTTVAMVWVAGRILRVGLLLQGKTATYRDMVRWIRAR